MRGGENSLSWRRFMVELFKTSSLSLVNDLLNMVAKPGNKLYFFPTFFPFKFHKHVPYHVCSDYNGIIFPDLLGSTNAYWMSFTAHIIVGNLKKNKKKKSALASIFPSNAFTFSFSISSFPSEKCKLAGPQEFTSRTVPQMLKKCPKGAELSLQKHRV